MRIALASDHAGIQERQSLGDALAKAGHQVQDLGCAPGTSVDYPDMAASVARAVVGGGAERGILICGTGIGVSIAANKVHGIRAAVVHDEFTADMASRHNAANVLCLGARLLSWHAMLRLAERWLATPFEGGRHAGRVEKIARLESPAADGCCD